LSDPPAIQRAAFVPELFEKTQAPCRLLSPVKGDEHDWPVTLQGEPSTFEYGRLGSFHIELDQIRRWEAVLLHKLVQAHRRHHERGVAQADQRILALFSIHRETGQACLVCQRNLDHLHVGKPVHDNVGKQVPEVLWQRLKGIDLSAPPTKREKNSV
jgi:hypothetical protein